MTTTTDNPVYVLDRAGSEPIRLSNKELFLLLDSLDAYRRQSFRQELPRDYMARIDGLINKVQGLIGAAGSYELAPATAR